jgi:hypothetical protein
MMQDSAVAPGFSPACAALKGGATYVALYSNHRQVGAHRAFRGLRPCSHSWSERGLKAQRR